MNDWKAMHEDLKRWNSLSIFWRVIQILPKKTTVFADGFWSHEGIKLWHAGKTTFWRRQSTCREVEVSRNFSWTTIPVMVYLLYFRLRGEKRSTIRESCAYFFLEVMTRLWFGGDSLPEDGLIDRLIEMAFPFEGRGAKARNTAFILDAVPGFPFILLRLLLQHK